MEDQEQPLPSLLEAVSKHTDVTYGDLALIGSSLLSTVSTVAIHGWASPGSTLDYTRQLADPHSLIVRDFVAWTSHRKRLADNCEERLRTFVDESGWTLHVLNQAATRLGLGE